MTALLGAFMLPARAYVVSLASLLAGGGHAASASAAVAATELRDDALPPAAARVAPQDGAAGSMADAENLSDAPLPRAAPAGAV